MPNMKTTKDINNVFNDIIQSKKLIQLKRIVSHGVKNLVRNKMMVFASVMVTVITMLVMGVCYVTANNINHQIDLHVDKEYSLSIFLNADINDESAVPFGELLKNDERVKSFVYTSKEEAFKEHRSRLPEESFDFIFEGKDKDFLPVSFDIVMNDNSQTQQLIDDLQLITYKDLSIQPGENIEPELCVIREVSSTEDLMNKISGLRRTIYIIGFGATALMGFFALVIISNTLMLSVFARKTEIEVMNHIGATKKYIIGPYIVEGCAIGGISAGIAFIVLGFVYNIFENIVNGISYAAGKIEIELIPFWNFAVVLFIVMVFAGIIIGSLGAMLSAGRNVKN